MQKLTLIAVSLSIAASGCNKPPVASISHPPAADLTCPAEPEALTDEQARSDVDGSLDAAFDDAALIAGRACRDALARVCQWHKDRGADEPNVCRPE